MTEPLKIHQFTAMVNLQKLILVLCFLSFRCWLLRSLHRILRFFLLQRHHRMVALLRGKQLHMVPTMIELKSVLLTI